jgi:branched-chain amino acid transport system substrate-binding protein
MRSIPILCQAGIVMVSPSNTRIGLTKPFQAGEPGVYYPGCPRNYARVIAPDDQEGTAAAIAASRIGATKAYFVSATGPMTPFVAAKFRARAAILGIAVVGEEEVPANPSAAAIDATVQHIQTSGADVVFNWAWSPPDLPVRLIKALRASGSQVAFIGSDGVSADSGFAQGAGAAAEGVYDVDYQNAGDYTGAASAWASRYVARFGQLQGVRTFALQGYEATNVVLAAIRAASRSGRVIDRAAVRTATLATTGFRGLLGQWSFDADGDIRVAAYGLRRISGGVYLSAGPITFTLP